jgi:hypothetical protein
MKNKINPLVLNIMKKLIGIIAASVLIVGCATPTADIPTAQQQAAKAAAYIQVIAEAAVNNTLPKNPDLRPYYEAAVGVIDLLVQNSEFDPDKLIAAIQNLKIKELSNDQVAKNLASALKLYQVEAADRISSGLDKNVYVKPLLLAVRNGISDGLK